jgi:2'-5' RNA ligase
LLGLNDGDAAPYPSDRPEAAPADHYLLFFALLPPAPVRCAAFMQGQRLRRAFGLAKPVMAEDRLHVTLQPVIGLPQQIPRLLVQAAIAAGQTVVPACRAVDMRFDRSGSMGVRPPTVLALHGDKASCQAIALLRRPLIAALRQHGFSIQPHDAPHLSLVYSTDVVPSRSIEPLCWTATELVLVLSHQGRGHHQHVARWPLRAA